jgi:hypothetical protein
MVRAQDLTLVFTMAPPQVITGWAITFAVYTALGGSAVVTKTVGAGITISDAGKGIISVALAKGDTAGQTVQDYVWAVKRTDSGNTVFLARGQLILEQEVF